MPELLKSRSRTALEFVLAAIPWVVSMYALYWLEYGELWSTQTAHRGKMSVAILVSGMGLSFLIYMYFSKRAKKPSD